MIHQAPFCEYAFQRETDIVCIKQTFCEYKSKYPDFHIKYCQKQIVEEERKRERERDLEAKLLNFKKN